MCIEQVRSLSQDSSHCHILYKRYGCDGLFYYCNNGAKPLLQGLWAVTR